MFSISIQIPINLRNLFKLLIGQIRNKRNKNQINKEVSYLQKTYLPKCSLNIKDNNLFIHVHVQVVALSVVLLAFTLGIGVYWQGIQLK